ncbi:MAG: DUF1801 domain-containing protein [bacterium]
MSPSQEIDNTIANNKGWRGDTLAKIRKIILSVDSDIIEEWKWRGVPVWYKNGMICTGEIYKHIVKMTFAKGAFLNDPSHLFNSSLDGNMRRAIDIHESDLINEDSLRDLIRSAINLNQSKNKK